MGISPSSPLQTDLFDINAEQIQKMRRLDEVVDRINRMNGSETIVIGSQQYTKKDGKGKADVLPTPSSTISGARTRPPAGATSLH